MVNYPTILGLPQEDIDRQLYVGVLGLESRVKALENKPKPTPTQTGTVTVTCIDSDETPLEDAKVSLLINFPPQSLDDAIGGGFTGSDGTTMIYELDSEGQPTQTVAQIPYGTYYLVAQEELQGLLYNDTITVDGDEEVTITLTPIEEGD